MYNEMYDKIFGKYSIKNIYKYVINNFNEIIKKNIS